MSRKPPNCWNTSDNKEIRLAKVIKKGPSGEPETIELWVDERVVNYGSFVMKTTYSSDQNDFTTVIEKIPFE